MLKSAAGKNAKPAVSVLTNQTRDHSYLLILSITSLVFDRRLTGDQYAREANPDFAFPALRSVIIFSLH